MITAAGRALYEAAALRAEVARLQAVVDAITRQCNLSELSEREKAKHDPRHMYYPTLHTSILRAYLRSDGEAL